MCIGMRFAMMEVKLATALMLTKLKLKRRPDTRFKPEKGDMFLMQTKDMFIDVEQR